ncbi:MAG TPA: hypothetical protein QGH10_16630, partial [Armatimonadota bacterium]|nr:hypothetical protein [Armatimonadota bacterium]
LELPSIGALTFGVGIHIGMLDDKLTDEEIETQIKALEADATTAADYERLHELCAKSAQREKSADARAKAAELYQEGLRATPDDPALLTGLGRMLVESGEVLKAEETLTRVVTNHPDHLDAYPPLLDSLQYQAVPFLAWVKGIANALPEAIEAYDLSPSRPVPAAGSGAAEELAAMLAEAAPTLLAGLEKLQTPPSLFQLSTRQRALERAAGWFAQARPRYLEKLNAEPTIEAFQDLIGAYSTVLTSDLMLVHARMIAAGDDPDLPQVAQAMMQVLSMPEMMEIGERVVAANPDHLGLRGLMGCLLAMSAVQELVAPIVGGEGVEFGTPELKKLTPAADHLTAAMALPVGEREGVLSALALMRFLMGEKAETLDLVEQAIDRGEWESSAVNSALLAMLDVSLGDMATETTDRVNEDIAAHPEVGETLTRWLEKLPQSEAQPHANLGRIRSASADWAGTVEALTRACEIDPTKAVYACGLGVAHLKLGQHAEAEQQLANALTMNFGDDEELEELTHHAHGVALLGLGKTAEAKEGLR